jgi:hypothetical protein
MASRQPDDLIQMGEKKTIGAHVERVSLPLNQFGKGRLDLAWPTCIYDEETYPVSTRRNLRFACVGFRINGITRVPEVSDRLGRRHQFEQQLKAFSGRFCQQEINASEISAGSIEALDEADSDGVGGLHKNDRDRLGRGFGSERTICTL